jgi:hypothetical protein
MYAKLRMHGVGESGAEVRHGYTVHKARTGRRKQAVLSPSWYAYKPVHCTRTTNPTKRIIFFSMRQDLISAQQSGVARARNFRSPKSTTTCSPRTPLSQPCSLLLGAAAAAAAGMATR